MSEQEERSAVVWGHNEWLNYKSIFVLFKIKLKMAFKLLWKKEGWSRNITLRVIRGISICGAKKGRDY